MAESSYPKSVAEVMRVLTEICQHQNRSELVEILANSHAHFEEINFDNWNGGTTTWALRLEVPTLIYAVSHLRLEELEKELVRKLDFLNRLHLNDPLGEVTITPLTSDEAALGQRISPSDVDVERLWRDGYLRMFLSHVSRHKVQVSNLKTALLKRGVAAFVAHEDIEPSLEWQNEISLALRSMHALTALITPDFHASNWTDQEIGWALGRGIPVFPVRLGSDPYGFIGKVQGMPGTLEDCATLATDLVNLLLRNQQTRGHMRRALVEAFVQSDSFNNAKNLKNTIIAIDDFTPEEKERLRLACKSNGQVAGSNGVKDAIFRAFGEPSQATKVMSDDIPF